MFRHDGDSLVEGEGEMLGEDAKGMDEAGVIGGRPLLALIPCPIRLHSITQHTQLCVGQT